MLYILGLCIYVHRSEAVVLPIDCVYQILHFIKSFDSQIMTFVWFSENYDESYVTLLALLVCFFSCSFPYFVYIFVLGKIGMQFVLELF